VPLLSHLFVPSRPLVQVMCFVIYFIVDVVFSLMHIATCDVEFVWGNSFLPLLLNCNAPKCEKTWLFCHVNIVSNQWTISEHQLSGQSQR